jgi:hypothetical protein
MSRVEIHGQVSEGTLLVEELIVRFERALKLIDNELYEAYALRCDERVAIGLQPGEVSEDDTALSDLFEVLDGCSPEGHSFTSHPDDPACYGFWEDDTLPPYDTFEKWFKHQVETCNFQPRDEEDMRYCWEAALASRPTQQNTELEVT